MMNINEFILGKEFQIALDEIKKIRLKTARIQKESWEMIKKIEEQYPQIYGHN